MPLKVLFISHNHPSIYPGGAEQSALELYEEMRDRHDEVEPMLLSRVGPPFTDRPLAHAGTSFGVMDGDVHQLAIYTSGAEFDWFNMTLTHKSLLTRDLRDLLLAQQPDVVHIQHTAYLGVDLVRQIRNTLPEAPIVYTLHDYFPICHRGGVMVRTRNNELCTHESPKRCNECFPEISPASFLMRKRFIQSHLELVDLFLAPSEFLLERYVEWGIPRERIELSDYGRLPPDQLAGERESPRARDQLGFFGQLNPWKGVLPLIRAMKILAGRSEEPGLATVNLRIHGSRVEGHFDGGFDEQLESLLESSDNVSMIGPYRSEDLPGLMRDVDWVVVPSIWWENSPLVIQEAFQHRRPVICSDIGAMAEKVRDGVDGLHFRAGDPQSMAQTIMRAVTRPDLWERLRDGAPTVPSVSDQARSLIDTYRRLMPARVGG